MFSCHELTELKYLNFYWNPICTLEKKKVQQMMNNLIQKPSLVPAISVSFTGKPYFYNILSWLMYTSLDQQLASFPACGPYQTTPSWTDREVIYSVLSQTSRSFWQDAQLLMSVPSEIESVTAQQRDGSIQPLICFATWERKKQGTKRRMRRQIWECKWKERRRWGE